jgi:hypothetical protein
MNYQELIKRHKVHSNLSDLNADERELYEAFLGLAVTERDSRILSRTWLRHHRKQVMRRG